MCSWSLVNLPYRCNALHTRGLYGDRIVEECDGGLKPIGCSLLLSGTVSKFLFCEDCRLAGGALAPREPCISNEGHVGEPKELAGFGDSCRFRSNEGKCVYLAARPSCHFRNDFSDVANLFYNTGNSIRNLLAAIRQ